MQKQSILFTEGKKLIDCTKSHIMISRVIYIYTYILQDDLKIPKTSIRAT